MGLSSFKFSWWAPKDACFETECVMALQGRPRSLTLAPIQSAYATSYWSSIVTLPRFRDIAAFLRRATPCTLFHPNFGGVPLDYIADGVAPRSEDPKVIIRVINFELTQHIRPRYINVSDRQTDRQTDRYDSNTALALRASRRNKTPLEASP